MTTDNIVQDCVAFHQKFGIPVNYKPTAATPEIKNFRKKLISEEGAELFEALDSGDFNKIAREAVDTINAIIGTLLVYGIPFGPIHRAVYDANMRKVKSSADTSITKPVKPSGWQGPDADIRAALAAVHRGPLYQTRRQAMTSIAGDTPTPIAPTPKTDEQKFKEAHAELSIQEAKMRLLETRNGPKTRASVALEAKLKAASPELPPLADNIEVAAAQVHAEVEAREKAKETVKSEADINAEKETVPENETVPTNNESLATVDAEPSPTNKEKKVIPF